MGSLSHLALWFSPLGLSTLQNQLTFTFKISIYQIRSAVFQNLFVSPSFLLFDQFYVCGHSKTPFVLWIVFFGILLKFRHWKQKSSALRKTDFSFCLVWNASDAVRNIPVVCDEDVPISGYSQITRTPIRMSGTPILKLGSSSTVAPDSSNFQFFFLWSPYQMSNAKLHMQF